MTGISFEVELDDVAAAERLRVMVAAMDNPAGFYRQVGALLLDATQQRFKREQGPDGQPWAPLSSRTVKARLRARKSGEGILRLRGLLYGSLNVESSSEEVRVGTPVVYAAIHQFGGTIQRQGGKGKIYRRLNRDGSVGRLFVKKRLKRKVETEVDIPAYQITIPARPFLGASRQDQDDILETALRWLGDNPGDVRSGA